MVRAGVLSKVIQGGELCPLRRHVKDWILLNVRVDTTTLPFSFAAQEIALFAPFRILQSWISIGSSVSLSLFGCRSAETWYQQAAAC